MGGIGRVSLNEAVVNAHSIYFESKSQASNSLGVGVPRPTRNSLSLPFSILK